MCTKIVDFVEEAVWFFRDCFKRKVTWGWFAVLVVGFMLRSDQDGITSVMRDLTLAPAVYEALIHFFRSNAWSLDTVRSSWYRLVREKAPLYKADGRFILIGDGVKQSKEGRRMPGVKKLHQESENSGKAEFIYGHMFGGLGILAGVPDCYACIPLSIRLHDGLRKAADWACGKGIDTASHVVQMILDGCNASLMFGDSLLVLDRYFLSVTGLETLAQFNASHPVRVDIVTRAKKNCTAYEKPGPRKPGRGRPRKKGATVHVRKLFEDRKNDFITTEIELYGKPVTVRYLCINLLWGAKRYQELRFVLTEIAGVQSIFVSTDPELDPATIIQLYSFRFSIEAMFRALKQWLGAFCYRFWSKHVPKVSHSKKKNISDPLEKVEDEHDRLLVLMTGQAIDMHMMISCIAMGILRMLSMKFGAQIDPTELRYLRTPSKGRISDATFMAWMRKVFLGFLLQKPDSRLTRLIRHAREGTLEGKTF